MLTNPLLKPPVGSIIDGTNGINDGQIACYLLNEGMGATVANLVDGSAGTFVNSPTWADGPYGPSVRLVAASSQRVDLGNWPALAGATKATIFASGSRPTAGTIWTFGQTLFNSNKLCVFAFTNDQLYAECGTSFASVTGQTFGQMTAGLVYDGSQAATWAARAPLFLNGRRLTYTSTTGTPFTSIPDGTGSQIGFEGGGVSRYTDGTFDVVRAWNRALSDDEMLMLHENPWLGIIDFLGVPEVITYYYPPSASFNPAWARRQPVLGVGVY